MARIDNLTNCLTDIADAIREKTGTTEEIPVSQYDEKIRGISSGDDSLNVFAQLDEPANKDGIWIKTKELIEYSQLTNIPYNFSSSATAVVETNVYLFDNKSNQNIVYKYNTLNDTYTKLNNSPENFSGGAAVSIGNNIYLFGESHSFTCAYKYDTLTDTYTQLADIPYPCNNKNSVAVGTDIYMFNDFPNHIGYAYKYDTLTDTYTKLADKPYTDMVIGVVDTNIYLFGTYVYKYDTLTDTYTQLSVLPDTILSDYSIAVSIEANIYLIALNGNDQRSVYKYDTLTDTYIQLNDLPYYSYYSNAVAVGNDIYLFGLVNDTWENYNILAKGTIIHAILKYKYNKVELVNSMENVSTSNSTVFITTGSNKVKLTKTLETYFSNAQIYDNDHLLEYPVYYGNGQEWVQINV